MDYGSVSVPLTLKQVDSLYWLGRYAERALSTMRIFINVYDSQLDTTFDYASYCRKLDIFNNFSSLKDFCFRYAFDSQYASSIVASLAFANGNAMMLRETIGSEALSYIEMSLRTMQAAQCSLSPA
ncbi:MAG: alpha-E domain-containing protein, partial [Treponema sp.]|nr:alpha-E domain-containing protein [Treponema sp.]